MCWYLRPQHIGIKFEFLLRRNMLHLQPMRATYRPATVRRRVFRWHTTLPCPDRCCPTCSFTHCWRVASDPTFETTSTTRSTYTAASRRTQWWRCFSSWQGSDALTRPSATSSMSTCWIPPRPQLATSTTPSTASFSERTTASNSFVRSYSNRLPTLTKRKWISSSSASSTKQTLSSRIMPAAVIAGLLLTPTYTTARRHSASPTSSSGRGSRKTTTIRSRRRRTSTIRYAASGFLTRARNFRNSRKKKRTRYRSRRRSGWSVWRSLESFWTTPIRGWKYRRRWTPVCLSEQAVTMPYS